MVLNIIMTLAGLILFVVFGPRVLNDVGFKFVPKIPVPFFGEFSRESALVVLSPKMIRFSSGWGVTQEIKVTNNSSDALYQIQLWVTAQKDGTNFSQLKIEPFNQSTLSQPVDSLNDTYVVGLDYSILRMDSPNGKSSLVIFIRAIDPRQTVSFKLTLPAEAIKKESTLGLEITDFSKEQARILYKEGSVAVPFRPIFPAHLSE